MHSGLPRRRRRVLFTLLAGLAGFGCRTALPAATVPISSWPGYEYFYLAQRLGLDRQAGVAIRAAQYPDPQTIVHAYLRGELVLAQLTTVELVDICARAPERCPVVVLVLDESRGGDQLLLRRGVASIGDLRGRPVAVTLSTLGPYVLHRALQRHGLRLQDVTLQNMPLGQMPEALASRSVDAAAIFPPFSSQAIATGAARLAFDSRAIPGEIFDILVVEPSYLQRHGATVVALIRAWQAAHNAAARADAAGATAIALMAQRQQLQPAAFRASEAGLVYLPLADQVELLNPDGQIAGNLRSVQQIQQQLGLLPPQALLPAVDNRFVRQALAETP